MHTLDSFLKKHYADDKTGINHTKIGNSELGVSGGSYAIPEDKMDEFYKIYKNHVFDKKLHAYLTEKQLEVGQIAIDLDFRYKSQIEKRQHTFTDITSFLQLCIECLDEIYENLNDKVLMFHIFEKKNVNLCDDKTKDGLHIMINIDCDKSIKLMLRKYVLRDLKMIWEHIPITNTWEDVFDEGVLKGNSNWQLYGSRKPGHEPYDLKYIFKVSKSGEDVNIEQININTIKIHEYFYKLSVRNKVGLVDDLKISPEKMDEYEEIKSTISNKKKKLNAIIKPSRVISLTNIHEINDEETLDLMIDHFLNSDETPYRLKELYNYTMALPKEFWGPGSYDKWIRVGWGLKNTHEKMYLTWVKFSSQSEEFDWLTNELHEQWQEFDFYNLDGVTDKSIIYWCKTHAKDKYDEIYKQSIHIHIYNSLMSDTDCDIANALYHLYNSNFVCASVSHDSWYEFKQNKWQEIDMGNSLRHLISTEMFNHYVNVFRSLELKYNEQQNSTNKGEAADDKPKINIKQIYQIVSSLKKTGRKNNIMREAKEIFYDKEFINKLDTNNYLLGCNNCVIDFKLKKHRKGKHDDYISKSTNINYYPISYYQKKSPKIIKEIEDFMKQVFPKDELRNYMWQHLASTLLGTTQNQTFNIYTGTGSNGKSKLIELMALVLGEYKGTVPISLVTQKRNSIGGASPEVYNLIGTRYAVMQEPSKGDKINEGILKELTGGDPIQCRALFKNSVTFIPQFKLAVATNTLLDITSDDDGTWRRMCVVDFEGKFTHKPFEDPRYPKEQYPHQFMIDPDLGDKFEIWAPVMLSMLVDLAYKTNGKVDIVDAVKNKSDEYRKEQNVLYEFYKDCIDPHPPEGRKYYLKISIIRETLSDWYGKVYGNRGERPAPKDVTKFFEQKHGKPTDKGWVGLRIKKQMVDEMNDDNEDDMI